MILRVYLTPNGHAVWSNGLMTPDRLYEIPSQIAKGRVDASRHGRRTNANASPSTSNGGIAQLSNDSRDAGQDEVYYRQSKIRDSKDTIIGNSLGAGLADEHIYARLAGQALFELTPNTEALS